MVADPIALGGRVPTAAMAARFRRQGYWSDLVLTDHLRRHAETRPDQVAIADAFGTTTFSDLLDRSLRAAGALRRMGVAPGDIFLIQLPNWASFTVLHLALTHLGAITVNVAITYRRHEVAAIAAQTGAVGVAVPVRFRGFDFPAMVAEVRASAPTVRAAVSVGGRHPGFVDYERLLETEPLTDPTPPDPDAITLISFTSGTTGEPKGVMHSSNTLGAIHTVFAEACGLGEDDTILMAAPVGHSIGLMHGVRLPIVLGATLVLQEVWDPAVASRLMREHQATFTVLAPTLLYDLIADPSLKADPPRDLKLLLCGGSYLTESLMRSAAAAMPHTAVAPLWGMTEGLGSLCGRECPPDKLATSDGRPVPGAELLILSPAGEPLPHGSEGELLLRSPTLFAGYYNRPEVNHEAFTEDGYFRTGDIAVLQPDGFMRIRGRLKELIIRGGVNISPVEIERALLTDPRVAQVAVVGAPDDRLGERICAFVVLAPGSALELGDLVRAAEAAGLAKQKWPERLEVVAELPATASGKIRRHVLAARLVGTAG